MASEPERLFDTTGVILAAGKGTRMKSDLPKVLHPVLEKPMISHVVSALDDAGVMRLVAVVGYKSEQVIPQLPAKVLYVHQREQLGTGHALMCAAPVCPRTGSLLVVCGDTPLIRGETLNRLVNERENTGAAGVVLTLVLEDPTGYGRVVRGEDDAVTEIVEHKDASEEVRKINEVNSGIYCFDASKVFSALNKVGSDNSQNEYYLPDVLKVFISQGEPVRSLVCEDEREVLGVNTVEQLKRVEQIMKERRNG